MLFLATYPTGNSVQGNYIGTDVNGTTDLGNTSEGVTIQSSFNNNIVGTNGDGADDTTEGNLISDNDSDGILVNGSNNNIIAGNQIGTNTAGSAAMANSSNGVQITNGAQSNRIGTDGNGTSDTDERNLISGNSQNGVLITGSSASSNRIAGNYIGSQADGSSPLMAPRQRLNRLIFLSVGKPR